MSYSKREPVKQIQLCPGGLPTRYPTSLRPSPWRARTWQTLLAVETASLAFAGWLRQRIRISRQAINDVLLNLALRERARRSRVIITECLSRGATILRHGLAKLGYAVLHLIRSGIRATILWLRSRRRDSQKKNEPALTYPDSRFEGYSAELRFPHLSSSPEQALRRDLARSHSQLVEQLLAEEEELARAATKVARLQSLIRAQERLLVEMTHGDGGLAERSRFFEASFDHLVGVGKTSDRDESRSMPPFRRH